MKSCVVIPARYASTRFPGKPLQKILGKEMILYVAESAAKAIDRQDIYILTDDKRIKFKAEENNFNCIMTSNYAITGTDRITEILDQLDYDYFINVQGDEPLVDPLDIIRCIELKNSYPEKVINGFTFINNWEEFYSQNIPKVIVDKNNFLIYISRSPIPGFKSNKKELFGLKRQVCIYGFNRNDLLFIKDKKEKEFLEYREDIEILRFLEEGREVLMFECNSNSISVDVPEDIEKVIGFLKLKNE